MNEIEFKPQEKKLTQEEFKMKLINRQREMKRIKNEIYIYKTTQHSKSLQGKNYYR